MEKIKNWFKDNTTELIFLGVIFIIAVFLRLVALNNFGEINFSELTSFYFADSNTLFQTLKNSVSQDINTPLYYVILHFWLKIFPASVVSARVCSLVFSLPLILISYFAIKTLFNKTAAYFSSLFLTFSTFCIFYSVEISSFSLVLPLSLLLSALFVLMLEKFDKKIVILYILSDIFLLYTFNLSVILEVFLFLVGFSYVLIKKRNIKDFIAIYSIIALLSLPGFIFIAFNYFHSMFNLCSFAKDIFPFGGGVFGDILENFFTSQNYSLFSNTNGYNDILAGFKSLKYVVLVFFPVIICLFGFFKALFSKNQRLILFLLPSLLTSIYILVISSTGEMFYQTKFLLMVFPVIICAMCFGFSLIRNKIVSIIVFSLIIYLNSMYLFFNHNNVFNYNFAGYDNLNTVSKNIAKISNDDFVIIPFSGNKFKTFIETGNLIPFSFDEALLLKDKSSLEFYFGKKMAKRLSASNIRSEIKPYIIENKIPPEFENNIKKYFDSLQKGQKFALFSMQESLTGHIELPFVVFENNYDSFSTYALLISKAHKDIKVLADKYLKPVNTYRDAKRNYAIFVWVKN